MAAGDAGRVDFAHIDVHFDRHALEVHSARSLHGKPVERANLVGNGTRHIDVVGEKIHEHRCVWLGPVTAGFSIVVKQPSIQVSHDPPGVEVSDDDSLFGFELAGDQLQRAFVATVIVDEDEMPEAERQ